MERTSHILETNWRQVEVMAILEKVNAINDWLDHNEDLIAIFEGESEILTELRGIGALVRTSRDDLLAKAETKKAGI
jgi:hypothetical protein